MSNPSQLPLQGCHVRVAKSQFWKDFTMLGKMSRDQQMDQLRQWSTEMKAPSSAQTKPFPAVSVRSASLATDVCDEDVTAVEAVNADSVSKCLEDIGNINGKEAVDNGKKAVNNGLTLVEDDHEVLQQIAKMEKRLLNIWEPGPAKLSEQQDTRILVLEEQLSIARSDSLYLESLLHVRDQDFARYVDLECKQRRQTMLYAEKVDTLEEKVEDFEEMVIELEVQLVKKDKIIQEQQIKLDTFRKADQVSLELSMAQKMLTNSNLAMFSKQKKTKLVSAHSLSYITTKPRSVGKDEMAMAKDREMKRRQAMQKEEITALVATVDRICARYDRYTIVSTIINLSEPRSDVVPDHLFSWVDSHLVSLWVHTVEPTMEEQEKHEKYLEKQMRPNPIYSPTLPKARVIWHHLNPNIKRNLPVQVQFTLHGCALDPEFYTTLASASYYLGQKRDSILLYESGEPFGSLFGFWTSKGVLSPPDEPVGGYHCCPETGTWIIAAEGG